MFQPSRALGCHLAFPWRKMSLSDVLVVTGKVNLTHNTQKPATRSSTRLRGPTECYLTLN
jgi:hypothetical protein